MCTEAHKEKISQRKKERRARRKAQRLAMDAGQIHFSTNISSQVRGKERKSHTFPSYRIQRQLE